MSLLPWKKNPGAVAPASSLTSLQSEMNRMFNQFFGDFGADNFAPFPTVSVSENAKTINVTAEVPGIAANDIDISVDGNLLTIRGQKNEEKRDEKDSWHRVERSFGSFMRRIELPADIDVAHVEATLDKGVLHLVLPKAAGERARSIKVTAK